MFLLDFPNNEVKEGFLTMAASNYLKTKENASTFVLYLSKTLKSGDLEEFRKMLTSFLSSIPYSMRRKENERERERYFHYTFYLLLRLMSLYTVYTEKEQSEGRVERLCLRVQIGRHGRGSLGTNRGEGLCPSLRGGCPQVVSDRCGFLLPDRHHIRLGSGISNIKTFHLSCAFLKKVDSVITN